MKRHMHLNLFIHSRGHHEASWRHPAASPLSLSNIRYYQALAQQAEAGLFDSIFLADQLALGDDIAHGPRTALEPITMLAALAVSTSRIGLIATASTTYTEPFNLARQFASLDHISRGLMEDWFTDGAADGFNVMPPVLPAMLEVFIAEVIPLLQRSGLFRTAYEGETLRAHYGLAAPDSQFG